MSGSARVTSIDVLQTLATAIRKFRGEATGALDELDVEIHRALDWIHHDRKDYWTHEARRSDEMVAQARVQLQQARTARRVADHEAACIDEQRALDRAMRRREVARQKVEAVRRASYAVDRAVDEFQRARTQFAGWIDVDIVRAVTILDHMSATLESYVSLEAPSASLPTIASGTQPPPGESPPPPSQPAEAAKPAEATKPVESTVPAKQEGQEGAEGTP